MSQETAWVTARMVLWRSGQVDARGEVVKSMEDRFLKDGNRDNALLKPDLNLPSLLSDRRRLGSSEYRERDFSERERVGGVGSLQLQNVGHVEDDIIECLLLGTLPLDEANVDEEDTAMFAVDVSAVEEGFRLAALDVGGVAISVSRSRKNEISISQVTAPSCLASSSNRSSMSSSVWSASSSNCSTVRRYPSSSTKPDWPEPVPFGRSGSCPLLDAIAGCWRGI